MHVDKESLPFLSHVLMKKRKQILADHQNPDLEYIDKSYIQGKQDVKASVWLEYIDFAIIKCLLDLKRYKELSDFFSDADRIFCGNIKNEVKKFITTVENENQSNDPSFPALKKMILAFLFEIIEDYSKALDYWKDYVFSKASENDQTPFKVAIRILINSHSNCWSSTRNGCLKASPACNSSLAKSESTRSCLTPSTTDSESCATASSTTSSWRTSITP